MSEAFCVTILISSFYRSSFSLLRESMKPPINTPEEGCVCVSELYLDTFKI